MSAIQASREEPGDLWDRMTRAGTEAFLDGCMDPAFQRVALIEAYAVLGWEEEQKLDLKYGLGFIRATLQELMDAELLAPQPIESLAYLILSLDNEAARYIAHADDRLTARKEVDASLERIFNGMRA